MAAHSHQILLLAFSCLLTCLLASQGDDDPIYKACVEQCQRSGCAGEKCFHHCKFSSDGEFLDGPWYRQDSLYLKWKHWDCQTDCRYQCMLVREEERQSLGDKPVKYHGKWPFQRVFSLQEPVSVALSTLILAIQFQGWISFCLFLNYKLPLLPNMKPYYAYSGLWHIYGFLAMNFWFWSAVFLSRNIDLTEKLDISSGVALIGFSLILAILRAFNVRDEATRVMISAPLIAFVTTHILFLNFYELDHGLNMKVCSIMEITQLLIWAIWANTTRHPSRWKVWVVVVGGSLAAFFKVYDFPPYWGYVDAYAISRFFSIPTYFWWSFVKDDAKFLRTALLDKVK